MSRVVFVSVYIEKQVSGDKFAKTEPAVRSHDNFHKKKRKKRPSIQTVVITDVDNHDEADAPNIPFPGTESLINGENDSSERVVRETNIANGTTNAGSTDKPSKRVDVDSVQFSNSENTETTCSGLTVNQNSDLDTSTSSEAPLEHQVTAVNGCVTEFSDDQRICEDKGGERTAGKTGDIDESHGQTVAGTSEVGQYMRTESPANEAEQPERDSEANREDVDLVYLVTKSQMDLSSSARGKEFSANDFHLEDSIVDDDGNVGDVQDASTLPKSDSAHATCELSQAHSITGTSEVHSTAHTPGLHSTAETSERHTTAEASELHSTVGTAEGHPSPKTENSDSENVETRNLENNDEVTASKTQNFRSEKSACSEDSGSGKPLSAQDDQQPGDCKEFSESADEEQHNYRVRKVENAEFISSSYSSSFSDAMGTSYDDRDLNFIPGIHNHRKTSGQRLGTSYESKTTTDNSISFDENGLPFFDTSHYLESSSSRPSSLDDASGRFSEIANEWDVFDDLLNVEEGHFSGPEVSMRELRKVYMCLKCICSQILRRIFFTEFNYLVFLDYVVVMMMVMVVVVVVMMAVMVIMEVAVMEVVTHTSPIHVGPHYPIYPRWSSLPSGAHRSHWWQW